MDRATWIAACAHELQKRWRTVPPEQLEDLAGDLWGDLLLRTLTPARAAEEWLEPVRPNGMLARLSAEEIAASMRGLPEAPEGVRTTVVIETVSFGRVRIECVRQVSRHRGKSGSLYWHAYRAEVVK